MDNVKNEAENMLARIIEYSYTAYNDNDDKRHYELMAELAATLITNITCGMGNEHEAAVKWAEVMGWLIESTKTETQAYFKGEINYKIIGEDI